MGDRDSFSLGYKGKRESNNNEDDKALKSHNIWVKIWAFLLRIMSLCKVSLVGGRKIGVTSIWANI